MSGINATIASMGSFQRVVLFLDFDGVLHPYRDGPGTHQLVNEKIKGLSANCFSCLGRFEQWLHRHPSVEVVFSTSWRLYVPVTELRSYFSPELRQRLKACTPPLLNSRRRKEVLQVVQDEIEADPAVRFLVLEDASWQFDPDEFLSVNSATPAWGRPGNSPYVYLTDQQTGLTDQDIKNLEYLMSMGSTIGGVTGEGDAQG